MKRLKSIFLIVCLAGPYLCIFLYLKHEQCMIRKQVKHMLLEEVDRSELISFTFTAYEVLHILYWEHAGEFEYNGEMYDVVEAEYNNGKITYWCWWDHDETKLNKQLDDLLVCFLGQDNETEEENTSTRFFLELDIIFTTADDPNMVADCYYLQQTTPYSQPVTDFIRGIQLPPPKVEPFSY